MRLFHKIRLFFVDNFTEAGRNYARCILANKVLEANGLKALRWDDGVPLNADNLAHDKMDLYLAVKTLRRNGHLIVDKDWHIIGTAHPSYYQSGGETEEPIDIEVNIGESQRNAGADSKARVQVNIGTHQRNAGRSFRKRYQDA